MDLTMFVCLWIFIRMGPQITLVQQWPKIIVERHSCATMTHKMWHKEHLWNVSVLQQKHLYNLVCITTV
jgi:hypothetical protein